MTRSGPHPSVHRHRVSIHDSIVSNSRFSLRRSRRRIAGARAISLPAAPRDAPTHLSIPVDERKKQKYRKEFNSKEKERNM